MQLNKPGYQELWDSDSGDESDVHCVGLRGKDCDQLFSRLPTRGLKSACSHTNNVSSGPTEACSCQQGGQAQSATCDWSRSVTEVFRVPGIAEAFILRSFDLQGLPCVSKEPPTFRNSPHASIFRVQISADQMTLYHVPDDMNLYQHRCDNLQFRILAISRVVTCPAFQNLPHYGALGYALSSVSLSYPLTNGS
jgi:hypothetical protein